MTPRLIVHARQVLVGMMLTLVLPAWALAQGTIAGVVRDASGGVLPGVTVEAVSPALIERVRSVITDGDGQYKLIDLRPGEYTVTFALPGFNSIQRDGIVLTANFTATVNAELRIGSLEETITVTGASPVVDTQNVVQQRVVTADLIDAAPSSRTFQNFAQLMPGVTIANANRPAPSDVGGTSGNRQRILVNGSRYNDFSQAIEGLSPNILNSAGSSSSITPNPAEVQEYSFDLGSSSAEIEKGGARVNVIPREGGNRFIGSLFATYANSSFQSDNLTDELTALGAGAGNPLDEIWDFSGAFGGPIKQDKLWFFGAGRYSGLTNLVSGLYYSADPESYLFTPDTNRPAVDDTYSTSAGFRLTWQATRANKLSFYALHQYECQCHVQTATGPPKAPEAAAAQIFPVNQLATVTWSAPVTNRLLFQAGALVYRQHLDQIARESYVTPDRISVTELSTGLQYRAPTMTAYTQHAQQTYRASLNYVTGSHALKAGMTLQQGSRSSRNIVNGDVNLQLLNGVPRTVVMFATPYEVTETVNRNFGLYAQEQWTVKRLTVNAGIRFDQIKASVPEQMLPAVQFASARTFAPVPNVPNWKDISPRLGASFDLFGNGRTALKVTVSRYVLGELVDFARSNNPVFTSVNSASRTWTDRNSDFNVDCDLLNFSANEECGPIGNVNFGKPTATTAYDDSLKAGWGSRGFNWETTVGIQHELMPGVSVSGTYFRRSYGNFQATDNLLVTPDDYDPFCITAPTDPRLPGGGGYQVCGLYDIKPTLFGQVNNLVTFAKNYGKETEIYTGYDISVTGRLRGGVMVQGGVNSGSATTNRCYVVDSPQQLLNCEVAPPYQTQVKGLAVYALPWWGLQTSATFQSIPGPEITASHVAPNAAVAPSLGRNLAAGPNATVTVPLINPGTLYADRTYQLDARVSKSLRFGEKRIQANFDLYNALNSSPVLAHNNTFGPAWLRPTYILPGRMVKLSAQLDF